MQIITVDELRSRIAGGEALRLLDVREPAEHAEFNVGGTLLPLGRVQGMQLEDIEDWKDDEVICYCRSGNRSGQACLILEMNGFKNVKNLQGGMLSWQEKFGNSK